MSRINVLSAARRVCAATGASALAVAVAFAVATPAAVAADVGNEADFTSAWENAATTEIVLGADITLTCDSGTPFRNSVTPIAIVGAGHTIRQTCADSSVLASHGDGAVSLVDVTITGGHAAGLASAGGGVFSDGALTVTNSTITGNVADGSGGGLVANGPITIMGSTISGNQAGGNGAGVSSSNLDNPITIVNSTITGNTVTNEGIGGGGISANDLTLVYSTVVGNSADVGANIFIHQGTFKFRSAFGSVVTDPQGGGENCGFQGPPDVTSNGYNFADDDSCLFTATGDRENAGDPQLGPLAANGGPTLTMLPSATSPLVNAIPIAVFDGEGACGVAADQRGVVRPQAVGCDIGAVEVAVSAPVAPAPITEAPRFTG